MKSWGFGGGNDGRALTGEEWGMGEGGGAVFRRARHGRENGGPPYSE